jgi:hypothetical protein
MKFLILIKAYQPAIIEANLTDTINDISMEDEIDR